MENPHQMSDPLLSLREHCSKVAVSLKHVLCDWNDFVLVTYPILFPPVAWEEKTSSWWLPRSGQRPCLARPTAGCAQTWSTLALRLALGTSSSAPSVLPGTCPTRASPRTTASCPWSRSWWERWAPAECCSGSAGPLANAWRGDGGAGIAKKTREVLQNLWSDWNHWWQTRHLPWQPRHSCCWENKLLHLAGTDAFLFPQHDVGKG